jgi:hypothetical protein
MKKIIIYFISIIVSIMLFIFLSIVGFFAVFTEKGEGTPNNFLNITIIVSWLIVFISIIYFIIKFLVSIYKYQK